MSNPSEENFELSYKTLRTYVGAMGFALPVVVVVGDLLDTGRGLRDSISAYYYSTMRDFFVGILSVVGLFLIAYRGPREPHEPPPIDNRVSTVAGVCAIGVAAFPTTNASVLVEANAGVAGMQRVGTFQLPPAWSNDLHIACAAVLFALLAYMSLCLFTKTRGPQPMTPEKVRRNTVYRASGWVMLAAIAAIAVCNLPFTRETIHALHPTFFGEWIALWAFAISWLVKGEKLPIYRDKRG